MCVYIGQMPGCMRMWKRFWIIHELTGMDASAFVCMDVWVDAACYCYDRMMLCGLMFASVSAHLGECMFVWLGLAYPGCRFCFWINSTHCAVCLPM